MEFDRPADEPSNVRKKSRCSHRIELGRHDILWVPQTTSRLSKFTNHSIPFLETFLHTFFNPLRPGLDPITLIVAHLAHESPTKSSAR